MSGEDFVRLPNGKKIYLKDFYGFVKENKALQKGRIANLFEAFDKDYSGCLSSGEVKSIFNSLKEFANQDGNNELSTAELMGFVKANVKDEYEAQMITPKQVMKCLEIIQEESEKNLKLYPDVHVENTVNKLFPELEFLNLGLDNSIDISKLSIEEIKKHFTADKYSIHEETKTEYYERIDENAMGVSDYEFPGSTPRIKRTLIISNNETGAVVAKAEDSNFNLSGYKITLNDEKSGRTIDIEYNEYKDEHNYNIMAAGRTLDESASMLITNGKISVASQGDEHYAFEDGILYSKFNNQEYIQYENGIEISRRTFSKPEPINESEQENKAVHENISPQLEGFIQAGNVNGITELINASVKNKNIGLDMDEYFAKTGRELIDDIQKLNMPEEDKKQLLNTMCEPYNDSKYYDAHKKIENSRVDNKYYTSADEYSVEYNGPIINVYNKATGKNTRINLKTLFKDMNYDREKFLQKSLATIQSYPGEVLENIAIEIAHISTMTKKESRSAFNGNGGAAGGYSYNSIDIYRTIHRYKGSVLVHETAHGMDDSSSNEWFSENSKFKEVYDKCIARYVESGHRRFDDRNPMKSSPIFPINNGTNYATYNEQEAFAICVEILMGYENSHTKFVRKVMPELIDAARDLYLEIRTKSQEERRNVE